MRKIPNHLAAVVTLALLAAPSAAGAHASLPPLPPATAQKIVTDFLSRFSRNDKVEPSTISRFYADRVDYYGHSFSKAALLREKLRFVASYPERNYTLVPNTISVACDAARTQCRIKGVMRWERRSRALVRSAGLSRLMLTISADSRGRIVREGSTFLD